VADTLNLSPLAERQFRKFSTFLQRRLKPHIDALANDPRPVGVAKVAGEPNLYRVRVGDYRIVYYVWDRDEHILIAKIAHRREVYR
jgi:mRNA interferase RelE/StbE